MSITEPFLAFLQRAGRGTAFNGIANGSLKQGGIGKAFDQVVLAAALDRHRPGVPVGQAGQYDHRRIGPCRQDGIDRRGARAVGQAKIGQNHIEFGAPAQRHGVGKGSCLGDGERNAGILGEQQVDQPSIARVILHD